MNLKDINQWWGKGMKAEQQKFLGATAPKSIPKAKLVVQEQARQIPSSWTRVKKSHAR